MRKKKIAGISHNGAWIIVRADNYLWEELSQKQCTEITTYSMETLSGYTYPHGYLFTLNPTRNQTPKE